MKNKIIILMLAVVLMTSLASAELSLWTTENIHQSESTVSQHSFYQFDDTSLFYIGRNKGIYIDFVYVIEPLPYNLTFYNSNYSGEIDWCNFTIFHLDHQYNSDSELIGVNDTIYNHYVTAPANLTTGRFTLYVHDKDSIIADMECHYTNDSFLYVENVLIGQYTTYFPSFECKDCEEFSFEILSNEFELMDEVTSDNTKIYNNIQGLIDMNFKLWLIVSWLVKIGFLVISIGLIFIGVYYLYKLFQDIERQI